MMSVVSMAACGGGSSGSDGGAGGKTKIQFMIFPGVANRLPVVAAIEKGYFAAENIDLEIVNQPDAIPGVQALISTKSQVGQFSVATVAQADQAGEDVKLFCGAIRVVQSSLMAPANTDLPSVGNGATPEQVLAALKDKRIGVQAPVGSGFQLLLKGTLDAAGATGVTYVNVGGSNAQADAAMQSGTLAAAITSPPGTQSLKASGNFKELLYMPAGPTQYKDFFGSAYGGPSAWLDQHPEQGQAFCRAVQKGMAFIKDPAHAEEATAILMKDTKLSQDLAKSVVSDTLGPYSTALPKDALEATLKGYRDFGVIKGSPEVTYGTIVKDLSAS
jgi:ABC-type nitrate/sulfonate/bicarbonate transport system substrate-binding protein